MSKQIRVCRCDLDSLLLDPPVGHRGIWAYDPVLYGEIQPGDEVEFICNDEVVIVGIAEQILPATRYSCSGVNSKELSWRPK